MSRKYKTIRVSVDCVMQDMGDEEERKPWSLPKCKDRAQDIVWDALSDYAGNHRRGSVFPKHSDENGRVYVVIHDQKFYEPKASTVK